MNNMHFDDSFFEGEVRDDFYIRPIMKRAWAAEMEVLEVISDICSRHGIKWFADSGTLLGAVRHKGFIPWDDDIDIAMLREDYEAFLRFAPAELPKGWRLFNGRQDPEPSDIFMRVINTDTVCIEPDFLKRNHGCPYIMGVDVFAFDSVPDAPEEEELIKAFLTVVYSCFGRTENGVLIGDCPGDVVDEINEITAALDVDIDRSKPVKRQMLELGDLIASMYHDVDTEYYTSMVYFTECPRLKFPSSAFSDTVMMPFEHIQIPVPVGYDAVLRAWYGDYYMTPRRGGGHGYPCFAKAEELLRQYYAQRGEEFPWEFE